jgi:hypothetical protein
MRGAALCIVALVSACAPLRSEPLPEVGPPEFARVVEERQLDVRAGETSGERAAWALLSLDPIVIAAAVLAVEDEHGRSQLFEYDLTLLRGGTATVQSRYIVQPGQCIMMRRPTGAGYVVIVAQDEARCQPSAEPEPSVQ